MYVRNLTGARNVWGSGYISEYMVKVHQTIYLKWDIHIAVKFCFFKKDTFAFYYAYATLEEHVCGGKVE